jgi:N-carbamoylputrescine amidase
MSQFKVALLQMTACENDQAANQAKGEDFCRRASAMGADIALFPEMWNVGYTPARVWNETYELWRAPEVWQNQAGEKTALPPPVDVWQGQAIGRGDAFIAHFKLLAKELNMAIAITYLEKWDGHPRNAVSIIDRQGEIRMTYAKLHTCDWSMDEGSLTPGEDFYVCTLDTTGGKVQIGTMICYDREFPESARILMLKGAEIILTPNGCDLEAHRLGQFKARAYENMVGLAMTNYAGPRMGHSIAFDPIAFDKQGSRDNLVIEAGESEGVYLAIFEMDQIRDYRQRETWGNAFRRPHRYGAITSTEVNKPFIRVNEAGEKYDTTQR